MKLLPGIRSRCLSIASIVLTTLALTSGPAHAVSQTRSGDVLSVALPAATLAVELSRGAWEGAWQHGLTFAVATASTEVLKRVTQVQRPDQSNDKSFPSGHAARAFSSAAYVRQRHGPAAALPLYAAALYVGHTRVAAKRHRWVDVAGAALVSELSAAWFVQRATDQRVKVSAVLDRGYVGASLALNW